MRKNRLAMALAFPFAFQASAQSVTAPAETDTPVKSLGVVTSHGSQASASLGIDKLTDETCWNFHPYPQRIYVADLKVNF